MIARLETLCGCTREIAIPEFRPEIMIPLIEPMSVKVDEPIKVVSCPRRVFRYSGLDDEILVYREA